MLRKLGRNLTLINVAVSGAILVLMAMIALGVTERMIAVQNENELGMYTRWSLATMHEALSADKPVYIRLPDRYLIYLEDGAGQARVVGEAGENEARIGVVTAQIREEIGGKLDAFWQSDRQKDAAKEAITFDRRLIASPGDSSPAPENRRPLLGYFARLEDRLAPRLASTLSNYLLTSAQGKKYRVSATVISSESAQNLVLLMQDREEEMTTRGRFRWIFGGCVAGGLVLIVLGSLYLSSRAIRPIDASIQKQRAFVAAASHELRTPVAALRANAEVLTDAELGEYTPYLDSIRSVSERMSLLISDLTDLARADAGELTVRMGAMDAQDVAAKSVQWMRPLAERKGIRISEALEPAPMAGDPDRLRQVLLALMDNALRYTPEDGVITVSTRREGRLAAVRVEDTGIGIPDDEKAHVFDRFYRLDAARSRESGGAGLGLSVVRELVKKMNGTIVLTDGPSGGTIMEMRFTTPQ